MDTSRQFRLSVVFGTISALGLALGLAACGGNNSVTTTTPTYGTVNTSMSDPAPCATATNGPFSAVYVTVTDVQASTSATAQAGSSGWVDLTPNLKNAPQQINLLGAASQSCMLAQLGDNQELAPGTYQQIRLYLAPSATSSITPSNACSTVSTSGGQTSANCVVLAGGTTVNLDLSSEAQTGLKIPSGQIAGGQFVVAAGKTSDLDINFNSCASIVAEGTGAYRLKPVLTAGEVTATSDSINGTLTNLPSGGKALVTLETTNGNGVDHVVMETTPDSSGNFVFCPVGSGTYDVVADAIGSNNIADAATVVTGVTAGETVGNMPLVAVASPGTPATITGQVSTAPVVTAGEDVSVGALQPITEMVNGQSATVQITVPLLGATSPLASITTATTPTSGAACATGTDCQSYSLPVPAANANVGAYSSGTVSYQQSSTTPVPYGVDALAPNCTASGATTTAEQTTTNNSAKTPLTVTAGTTSNAEELSFTGCS